MQKKCKKCKKKSGTVTATPPEQPKGRPNEGRDARHHAAGMEKLMKAAEKSSSKRRPPSCCRYGKTDEGCGNGVKQGTMQERIKKKNKTDKRLY